MHMTHVFFFRLCKKKLLEVIEGPRPMVDAMPSSTQQPSEATQLSAVEAIQPPASAPGQVKNEEAPLVCCSERTTNHAPKYSPRQSCQHGCHFEEERCVQLGISGFQFAPRVYDFDWQRVLAVNDEEISNNGDITTLKSILPDIAFGEVDWSRMGVDPTLRKAYETAQLSCQVSFLSLCHYIVYLTQLKGLNVHFFYCHSTNQSTCCTVKRYLKHSAVLLRKLNLDCRYSKNFHE